MRKEITKEVKEIVTVCDICGGTAKHGCAVCGKDVCEIDSFEVVNNAVQFQYLYLCKQCSELPFSEVWKKIEDRYLGGTLYLPTTTVELPVRWNWPLSSGTGDVWWYPNITTMCTWFEFDWAIKGV